MATTDVLDLGRLRLRLILGCCLVAFIVSSIFVYSSFRLSSDLAHELERDALSNEAIIALAELEHFVAQHGASMEKLTLLCESLENSPGVSERAAYFLFDANNRLLCAQNSNKLRKEIHSETELSALLQNSTLNMGNEAYLVASVKSEAAPLTLIAARPIRSDAKVREFVVKRLSIVSFITFWAAVWVAIIVSVAVSKRVEKNGSRLAHLATHDDLTGVYNRFSIMKSIDAFAAKVLEGGKGAVLFTDLNRFKEVNDNLGHAIGDVVLCTTAERLRVTVGSSGIVARMGGDEFVIWLENASKEEAEKIAGDISLACSKQIKLSNEGISVGISIGCAIYPEHGERANDLLKNADEAMFRAKALRQHLVMFSPEDIDHNESRLILRSQIEQGIKSQEFVLHFQPKIRMTDGKVIGAEALARWQHSTEGMLPPAAFIDLIEQSEIVYSFGHYVLEKAINQLGQWHKAGRPLSMAVNLSPYNMLDTELPLLISRLLTEHKVDPSALEIELTESATMINLDAIATMFVQLNALGVEISIDDFGTGMSSFAYLKKLNVATVKIDREFIRDIGTREQDELVVAGIISLCKKMRKTVVAEGVETVEQEKRLIEMGCEYAQGYYYAKPLSSSEFMNYLQAQETPKLSKQEA